MGISAPVLYDMSDCGTHFLFNAPGAMMGLAATQEQISPVIEFVDGAALRSGRWR